MIKIHFVKIVFEVHMSSDRGLQPLVLKSHVALRIVDSTCNLVKLEINGYTRTKPGLKIHISIRTISRLKQV